MRTSVGIIAALLLTAGLVGCGGDDGNSGIASANGSTGSPSSSATPSGNDRDSDLKFAQCMRENGVPKFPDPDPNGGVGVDLNQMGVDKAKVDAAQEKCKKYAPNGGEPPKLDPQVVEQMRRYAACMRENGVPRFPDPPETGGFQLDMNKLGMDPNDPKFKAANEKCNKILPAPPGGGSFSNQSGESA